SLGSWCLEFSSWSLPLYSSCFRETSLLTLTGPIGGDGTGGETSCDLAGTAYDPRQKVPPTFRSAALPRSPGRLLEVCVCQLAAGRAGARVSQCLRLGLTRVWVEHQGRSCPLRRAEVEHVIE